MGHGDYVMPLLLDLGLILTLDVGDRSAIMRVGPLPVDEVAVDGFGGLRLMFTGQMVSLVLRGYVVEVPVAPVKIVGCV